GLTSSVSFIWVGRRAWENIVMKKQDGPNWAEIRAEYIYTDISTRDLAEKAGVPYQTLKKRATREGWTQLRSAMAAEVDAEVRKAVVEESVDRHKRIMDITDTIAEKLKLRAERFTGMENPAAFKDLLSAVKTLMDVQGIQPQSEDKGGDILRVEGFNSEWQE
ncbi:MAG: hypothetical protein J6I89_06905, partial [Oscillospiraceae bacterium]|nr:hypothetical protein [Oscillospiraceae bacterium]